MTNSNDPRIRNYDRTGSRDSVIDGDRYANPHLDPNQPVRDEAGLVNQRPDVANGVPIPPEGTPYRQGYKQGRLSGRHVQEEYIRARENDSAARGLLLGIVVTSILGLLLGFLFYITRDTAPTPQSVVAPIPPTTEPQQVQPATGAQPQGQQPVVEQPETPTETIVVPQPVFVPVPDQTQTAPPAEGQVPVAPQPQVQPQQPQLQTQPDFDSPTNDTGEAVSPQ